MEEKIYLGSLGTLKVRDRVPWRSAIQYGGYDRQTDGLAWGGRTSTVDTPFESRDGIHGCRNCIYDRKIYDSVVDLLMKLAQFWYFGHVSKSLVAKSTTAMNPNHGILGGP